MKKKLFSVLGLFARRQVSGNPSAARDHRNLSGTEADVPRTGLHQRRGVVQAQVQLPAKNAQTKRGWLSFWDLPKAHFIALRRIVAFFGI